IGTEELLQHLSSHPSLDGMTRRVVLIRWCYLKWCPRRVTARPNSGDRTPEVVVVLRRNHGQVAVRQCHIEDREQSHALPLVQSLLGRDRSGNSAPFQRRAFHPEQGDFGLIRRPLAGCGLAIAAERFHLVQVSREALIGDRVIWSRPKLSGVLKHERRD